MTKKSKKQINTNVIVNLDNDVILKQAIDADLERLQEKAYQERLEQTMDSVDDAIYELDLDNKQFKIIYKQFDKVIDMFTQRNRVMEDVFNTLIKANINDDAKLKCNL